MYILIEQLRQALWACKESTDPKDKRSFVETKVKRFIDSWTRLRKTNSAVVAELLIGISYTNQETNANPVTGPSFSIKLEDAAQLFGMTNDEQPGQDSNEVKFTLVEQFTQKLDARSIANLPRDTSPGTAYHVWKMEYKGSIKYCIVFRGTNSHGEDRDRTLTGDDATGALTNTNVHAVAHGVIEYWMDSLRKYLTNIAFVVGHSAGAALAQDCVQKILDATGKAPRALFAMAPGRQRQASQSWIENSQYFMFTESGPGDPVPLAGIFSWPGMVSRFGWMDVPCQKHLVDSTFDQWVTHHGTFVILLKLARGDEIVWQPRASPSVLPTWLWKLVDKARPGLAKKIFTPVPKESIMDDLRNLGIEKLICGDETRYGIKHGLLVNLVDLMLRSGSISDRYAYHKEPFIRSTLEKMDQLFRADDIGEAVRRLLTTLTEQPLHLLPDEMCVDDPDWSTDGHRRIVDLVNTHKQEYCASTGTAPTG